MNKLQISLAIMKQIALPGGWDKFNRNIHIAQQILIKRNFKNATLGDVRCPVCGCNSVTLMGDVYYCTTPMCLTPLTGFVPIRKVER